MGDLSYARYRLQEAVKMLCIGEGDIKTRLRTAFNRNLNAVFVDDMPDDLKPKLTLIRQRLTRKDPIGDERSLNATLYRMRKKTAATIANDIWELYNELESRSE